MISFSVGGRLFRGDMGIPQVYVITLMYEAGLDLFKDGGFAAGQDRSQDLILLENLKDDGDDVFKLVEGDDVVGGPEEGGDDFLNGGEGADGALGGLEGFTDSGSEDSIAKTIETR